MEELTEHIDIGPNWTVVGTLLKLNQRRLDDINQQSSSSATKIIKMFELWLNTTPTASRRQVLEALRKRVVAENTVANEYEEYLKQQYKESCMLVLLLCLHS